MAAPSHVSMNRHDPSPKAPAPRATAPAFRPDGQPPRPVAGPEGARIRLQLGATGADYLLLLDEDDGNVEWQTRTSSDWVPAGLSAQLNRLQAANQFVREVGLGPGGEWFVHGVDRDGTGTYSWWDKAFAASRQLREWTGELQERLHVEFGDGGRWLLLQGHNGFCGSERVDAALQARIRRVHAKKGSIGCVTLLPGGGYYIADDTEGTLLFGARADLAAEVRRPTADAIVDVVCDGTDAAAWVVLRRHWFRASAAVTPALVSRLTHFYIAQRQRRLARDAMLQAYQKGREDYAQFRKARERAKWQRKLRSAAAEATAAAQQQQQLSQRGGGGGGSGRGGAPSAQLQQLQQMDAMKEAQLAQLRRELAMLSTSAAGAAAVLGPEAAQWQALLEQSILARREEKEREIEEENAGVVFGLIRSAGLA